MSAPSPIIWARRAVVVVMLVLISVIWGVRQSEYPHPWFFGAKASAEHIMKAPESRRWDVVRSYGVLAAEKLSFEQIRLRGDALPMALEAAYYDGAAHHQRGDFDSLDNWVTEIDTFIPDVHRAFFYDGIMRLFVVANAESPEMVMKFAEKLSRRTGGSDLSNGIRIGIQQALGSDIEGASAVASTYPPHIHAALFEELGWRVGDEQGVSATHWARYRDSIPPTSQCAFAEGMTRGAVIVGIGERTEWWPDVEQFMAALPAGCAISIRSGVAEALLIVLGDDPENMMTVVGQIEEAGHSNAIRTLIKSRQHHH